MRSIRTALLLGTTIATAALFLAAGILLYVLVRDGLVDQFDRALVDKARLLASVVEYDEGKVETDFDDLDMHEFERADRPGYLELWGSDNAAIFRSPSLGQGDLARPGGGRDTAEWVDLPDGRAGRAVGITFTPRADNNSQGEGGQAGEADAAGQPGLAHPAVTLVLARETAPIDAILARLRTVLISVGVLAIAVSGGVLWVVIRRSLRPMDRLATEIGQVDEQDLSSRVQVPDAPRELQPVVVRLNDLIRRVESAMERERAFSADVAHELRTPLAGLRSTLEVTGLQPRQAADYEEAIRECLRITVDLQRMVENLLSLARLEAGQVEVRREPVFPNDVLREAWDLLEAAATERRLTVTWALGPQEAVQTDPTLLGLVARNLLENAVTHAEEGGVVRIETTVADGQSLVRIANSGSRLSQEQAERVFDRLWRGDAARSTAGVHCGLGLSLVAKALAVLGGSVKAQSQEGGEFRVTVSLPHVPPGMPRTS